MGTGALIIICVPDTRLHSKLTFFGMSARVNIGLLACVCKHVCTHVHDYVCECVYVCVLYGPLCSFQTCWVMSTGPSIFNFNSRVC